MYLIKLENRDATAALMPLLLSSERPFTKQFRPFCANHGSCGRARSPSQPSATHEAALKRWGVVHRMAMRRRSGRASLCS